MSVQEKQLSLAVQVVLASPGEQSSVRFTKRVTNEHYPAQVLCEKDTDANSDEKSNSTIRSKFVELREQVNLALNKFDRELQQLEARSGNEVGKLRAENESLKQQLDKIKKLLGVNG